LEATKETSRLNEHGWIAQLPPQYQPVAKTFQTTMNEIDPQYKLGVNV
jgi:hypothetical protein